MRNIDSLKLILEFCYENELTAEIITMNEETSITITGYMENDGFKFVHRKCPDFYSLWCYFMEKYNEFKNKEDDYGYNGN